MAVPLIVVTPSAPMQFSVDKMFLSLMGHAVAQFNELRAMLNDKHKNISRNDLHTTERMSPVHVSKDDSSVNDTLTSARSNIPHEYPSGTEEHYGSPSCEKARPGDEDTFRPYLVQCIKYHQAIMFFKL
jgi:hypothetical protein